MKAKSKSAAAKPKPLSWEPVRDQEAGTYCAPACGSRCKFTDYLAAAQAAETTCAALGKGWRPRVWENMGWHWSVYLPIGRRKEYRHGTPRVQLNASGSGKFWASLEGLGHQRTGPTVVGAAYAVKRLVDELEAEVEQAQRAVTAVKGVLA